MILITGGKGQLASALTDLLKGKQISYVAYEKAELDITDFGIVHETISSEKPDLVINCAAYNEVDEAELDPCAAIRVNAMGTRNLALACHDMKIPLMHFSTDYVFNGQTSEDYTIAHAPSPINAYGRSKHLGETLLTSLCARYYLIRVSWVFGRGNRNFLYKLFHWAKNKDTLEIVDDQISSPTYAPHLAEAVFELASSGAFGLYHLRNRGECSRYEWARYALKKAGWKGKVLPVSSSTFPTAAKRPKRTVLSICPLDKDLKYDMPTWKQATDEWLKERKEI